MNLETEYLVQLHGSGLIGDIFGQDAFFDTHLILKKLRENGQLKCFKWWCPACKSPELTNDNDLISHAFSITFPTVRRIMADYEVDWRWLESQSDWAKLNKNPRDAAYKLLNSKSRPKWKVILAIAVYES